MRESASGPMPVVYDAIPDDDCVVSVYPMIPPNKEFAADMPKTASCLLKRKSGKGLGTRAAPGGGAKSMKCGLETADAAWGQDVVTKGQEEVTRGRKDHNEVSSGKDLVDQEEAKKPGPGGDDGGPERSGAQTQGPQQSDERGGPRGPRSEKTGPRRS